MAHPVLPKTGFFWNFWLHPCCRQHGCNCNHCEWRRFQSYRIMAIAPFKVTTFGANRKPLCDLWCANYTVPTCIVSGTVSEIRRIIGQIFTVDIGWTPKFMIAKFRLKRLETSFCGMVQSIFRYLEPFRRGSRVWQRHRRTDFLVANAVLSYVRCTDKMQ